MDNLLVLAALLDADLAVVDRGAGVQGANHRHYGGLRTLGGYRHTSRIQEGSTHR